MESTRYFNFKMADTKMEPLHLYEENSPTLISDFIFNA